MYDVFVSYSHLDGEKLLPIVSRLQSNFKCWIDDFSINGGDKFIQKLVDGIQDSRIVLFFSSKAANDSKWTEKEVALAAELQKPILPVRLDNSKYSQAIHFELSGVEYISMHNGDMEASMKKLIESIKHMLRGTCVTTNIILTLKNGAKLEMIYCPSGEFLMGSPESEIGHHENEWLHKEQINNGFWIGRFPVTEEQYSVFDNSEKSVCGQYPAVRKSWFAAREFCHQLPDKIIEVNAIPYGYHFDLPTEVQWEYACRAGTTSALNSGEELTNIQTCVNLDKLGWYAGNQGKTYKGRTPVGKKLPNAWGIYDMHGLIWEWCDDSFGYYGHDKPANSTKIMRGGAWDSDARGCRSANRYSYKPDTTSSRIGFRVALVK